MARIFSTYMAYVRSYRQYFMITSFLLVRLLLLGLLTIFVATGVRVPPHWRRNVQERGGGVLESGEL